MPQLPEHLREFDDTDSARKLIYSNVLDSLQKRFPIEDDNYRLELSNLKYAGPQHFTLDQQKQALMKDRHLHTPIQGKWRLMDKATNAVLDEKDDVVMHVPYYTPRGTFIFNGNEYSVISQSRLKPGAYTRKRKTGEVETQFNVRPTTGRSFHVRLEPETGVFKFNMEQSNIPLYTLLNVMGVSDQELMKAWGPEMLEANIKKQDRRALPKMYERLAGYKFDPNAKEDDMKKYINESLAKYEVDPDVMARTLGLKDVGNITPQALIRATQKMLNVSKGTEQADDRDTPMYSNIYSVEDLIQERIDKDAGRLAKSLLFKARRSKNMDHIRRGALDPYVLGQNGFLLASRLTMPLEETNPLHTLEQTARITKLGQGGISSAESITDEARDVNNGQFGFIDPITGPEHMNVGIDVRASYKSFKGKDKQIYGEFRHPQSGKLFYLRPEDVADKAVAFPGEMKKTGDTAVVMQHGKIQRVPKAEVDYEVPSFGHMMSSHTNLNPMPTAVQAGRQFYGAKFWSQYLPMTEGETPLVDSLTPDGKQTFSEYYGRKVGALNSKVAGTVAKISENAITLVGDDGQKHVTDLVKDFPFNRLTGISYFPAVKPGDRVNVGDMLAHSNFTDSKTGGINMGRNLKTLVIPARGMSYEDAYVISETASKKMTTERLYGFDQESRQGVDIGKNKFISTFAQKFTRDQVANIDDEGVVKPGTVVHKGDPLILAVGPKLLTSADAQLGKLHKVLRNAFTDKSVIWESNYPGTVTDVAQTGHGARVNVKSTPPVQVGDKLTTRFGLKGVVGTIVPDDKMPRDVVTNEPYELLLNPMGVLSRVAPNQIIEMSLAKLAKATGKQVRLPQEAPEEGWAAWAQNQLKAAGVREDNDVFDPETGKTMKGVSDGYAYLAAFHHLAEKKLSARGESGAYTIDEQPAKGGHEGAKKFSQMDVNATLAHGAPEVIRDVQLIRGTKNEEFWKSLKLGRPLPEPKVPFIYDKFLNTLRAGGVNVQEKGDTVSLMPMTDADVTELSKGKLDSKKPFDMVTPDFEPMPGGLFDMGKTGGMDGNRWTHIELSEPLPNPVMEEPIRRVLGLKVQELRDIIAGKKELNGLTGGRGLQEALKNVDIDAAIEEHKDKVKQLRGSNRDNSVKVLGYLSAAKKQGVHPSAWMIGKVPVLPPKFRPVSRMGDVALVTDLNELYASIMEVNNNIHDMRKHLPESELAEQKGLLYDAVTAAFGLGDSINTEGKSKRLKGAIRQIIGTNPKTGLFQSRVISKTVSGVGRGVVTPDPNLDMDSIGIPEDSAWNLYKDFVMRRLVRRGYPSVRSLEMIEKRDPTATEMLNEEMASRPVLVDRAPTWHKFNLLAFYPHVVEGNTIRVSPLITKGFTMDFDGDQANFHVPVSDKAVAQSKDKMLPSRNLFSLTDLKSVRHSPSMEMTLGLYWLTREKTGKPPQKFASMTEAKKAYHEGKIGLNDPIVIGA